jgi:hypothetical protein
MVLGLVVSMSVVGCGGDRPPAKAAPEPERAFRRGGDESNLEVAAEVGGLPEEEVQRIFKRSMKGFTRCLTDGYSRIEFLGGDVVLYVAVNRNGELERAYLERSTLGDRATERCMVEVLRAQHWPKPVGGKLGEARHSLGWDPPADVRPPIEWTPDDISDGLGKVQEGLDTCKAQASAGRYSITMYVGTDGAPMSVGVSPPVGDADLASDCLVGAILGAKFKSPGSYPAKVTFEL